MARSGFIARGVLAAALAVVGAAAGGCRADRPSSVPRDAERLAGGRRGESRHVEAVSPFDGTFYVVDDWDASLDFSGPVHKGDMVVIDVNDGRVTVNGQTVYQHRMRHTDHLIFAARGSGGAS